MALYNVSEWVNDIVFQNFIKDPEELRRISLSKEDMLVQAATSSRSVLINQKVGSLLLLEMMRQ